MNNIGLNKIKFYIKRGERQLSYLNFHVVHDDDHVFHDHDHALHDHDRLYDHLYDHGCVYNLKNVYVMFKLWRYFFFNENGYSFKNVYVEVLSKKIINLFFFSSYQKFNHAYNFIHVYGHEYVNLYSHDSVKVHENHDHFSYHSLYH